MPGLRTRLYTGIGSWSLKRSITMNSIGNLRAYGSGFAQEHIVRGVGLVPEAADGLACAVTLAALGVDPLHGGDIGKNAAAVPRGHVELEPGDVIWCRARGVAGDLGADAAAIAVVPARPGI